MNRLLILFFVSVVDLLGFGIVIPLLPYMGDSFGASPAEITWILMSYGVCQLVSAPIWGRLSDKFGRRPILLFSFAGAGVSYLILGFSTTLWGLLLSRIIGGIMAGNISALLAYAGDISTPADRAKSLGTVGAAIGVGFMLGPAIGGLLAGNDIQTANFVAPAIVAASLSLVAIGLVAFVLPESLTAEQRLAAAAMNQKESPLRLLARLPGLRRITIAALIVITAQAILESVTGLWALKRFNYGPMTVGLILFGIALVAVIFQGGLIRVLAPRFGERRLAIAGAAAYTVGLMGIAVAPTFAWSIIGLAFCAAGQGLWQPSASSLASQQSNDGNRGAIMGTYQASSSLARVLGPAVSGPVFGAFGPSAPYALASVIAALAILLLLRPLGTSS